MSGFGDIRNDKCIELARASGGFVSQVPPEWWDAPDVWLEAKRDDIRVSLQFDLGKNWIIGRNREDKLKGVDRAGAFMDKSDKLPHLRDFVRPKLAGLMFDGGVSDRKSSVGGRGGDVGTLMKENPTQLVYCAWDLLFDANVKDVRLLPQRERRALLEQRVAAMGSPHITVAEKLPPTKDAIQKLIDAGWEGGVLKRGDACYRSTHGWYKAKGESPVDAIILNYIPEKRGGSPKKGIKATPTGRIGGFYLGMKSRETGKIVPVGFCMMGLTDEIKDRGVKNFNEFKGKVVECAASGWSGAEFRWLQFRRFHPEQDKMPILEEQLGALPVFVGEEA